MEQNVEDHHMEEEEDDDEIGKCRLFVAKSFAALMDIVTEIQNENKGLKREIIDLRQEVDKLSIQQNKTAKDIEAGIQNSECKQDSNLKRKLEELESTLKKDVGASIAEVHADLEKRDQKLLSMESRSSDAVIQEEVKKLKTELEASLHGKTIGTITAFVNAGLEKINPQPQSGIDLMITNALYNMEGNTVADYVVLESAANPEPIPTASTPNPGPVISVNPMDFHSGLSTIDCSGEGSLDVSTATNMSSSIVVSDLGLGLSVDGSGNGGKSKKRKTITDMDKLPEPLRAKLQPYGKNASMAVHSMLNPVQRAFVKWFLDNNDMKRSNQALSADIITAGIKNHIFSGDEMFDSKTLSQYLQTRLIYEKKKNKKYISIEKLTNKFRRQ